MESDRMVVEINGAKFEIDTRQAKRIELMRVGDRVKVLVKGYGDSFTVHHGVVIGFDEFASLPTINVAYFSSSYSGGEIKFAAFNAKTTNLELVASTDDDAMEFSRDDAVTALTRNVEKAERGVADAKAQLEYFERNFGRYWAPSKV